MSLQYGPAQDDGTVMCVPSHTADPADREPFPEAPVYVTPPELCPREIGGTFPLMTPPPVYVDDPEPTPNETLEVQLPLPEPYLPDELAYTGQDVWLVLVLAVLFIFAGGSVLVNTPVSGEGDR